MPYIPNRKSKEISEKFAVERNTFKRNIKANKERKIDVEIGDSKSDDFKPQVKTSWFDNEYNRSVRAGEHPNAKVRTLGNKIIYETPEYDVVQYEKPDAGEEGGHELEWVLPRKPKSNVLPFTLRYKGDVRFYFQPALDKEITPKEGETVTATHYHDADGNVLAHRPENVVNSVAVYIDKQNHRKGGNNYATGKIEHIYRPKAIDAEGNEAWCELNIPEEGEAEMNIECNVTVPQEFLDKAVYPVVVDPTFGYDTVGGTGDVNSGDDIYMGSGVLGSNGNVTSISFYTGDEFGSMEQKVMLVDNNLSISGSIEVKTVETFQWYTYTLSNQPSVTAGNTYYPGFIAPFTGYYQYDSGSSGDSKTDTSNSYSSPSDPTDATNSSQKRSIYATYIVGLPSVDTNAVTSIDHTTATGNGDVADAGDSAVTERGVVWNTSGSPTTADNKSIVSGTTGTFSASMTGLSPGTTYFVRAYATNSYGTAYGSEVEFATLATEAPVVTTSAVDNIGETSADGNGEITDVNGADASERGFVYDTVSRAEPTGSGTTLNDSESFETNLGDWTNDAGNVSDWIRNSGGTPSSNTGPSSAQDGSYYIYVETSSGNSYSNGDTDIITYNIGSTIDGYVDFYYHQYGNDQGTLSLEGYDGSSWTEIWSSTGDQGNQWNNIGQASTEFFGYSQLRFKNVAVGSFNGDVALDNINVYEEDPVSSPAQSDYTSVVNETGTFSTGAFSLSITGLTASTTYYVRAYAENSEGYSYGSEVSFSTLSGNQAPTANDDSDTTPFETAVNIDVLANDTDPESDTLTVDAITVQASNGTAIIQGDDTITYTPDNGFSGQDTFTYQISDTASNTDTAVVTVTVADRLDAYSRAALASLPTDASDLSTVFSSSERTDVGASDNTRVSQSGNDGEYVIEQFKYVHTNDTDQVTVSIEKQTDHNPATNAVILEMYNYTTGSWEQLDSNNSASVDTDFTLSGSKTGADYYDANNVVAVRVYQFKSA